MTCKYCGGGGYFRWQKTSSMCPCPCKGCTELAVPAHSRTIPDGWIKCSDRMPEELGRYLCYIEEQNSLGKIHYQWNCSWNGDVFSDVALSGTVTHWMPLPAAPHRETD